MYAVVFKLFQSNIILKDMIVLLIFLSCILGSTMGRKKIENDQSYPDASRTNKGNNPFLSRIRRDVPDPSNNCILPWTRGIASYTKVGCEQNCLILDGRFVQSREIVRLNCDLGYGPASNTQYDVSYICVNGKWIHREPECVKLCPALEKEHLKIECFHGIESVKCDSYLRPGTVAKVSCDDFYRPSYDPKTYSDRTTCLNGGTWSERLPTCSLDCGRVNQVNKVDATLVFANKTTYGEYPWHVAIYMKVSDRYKYICGGSLITENFILTAAHCMFNPNETNVKFKESDLKVAAGKGKRDYYIQERYQVNSDVIEIIVPDTYVGDGTRYAEDIALLQTDVSFKFNHFILPVCLDRFNAVKFDKNTKGTIVGWGLTEDGTLSDELGQVHLPIMPIVQCRTFFPDFLQFLTSDKYCVIHQNGSGTGRGDSGGGMTFDVFGQHYIRGIVSIKKTDSNIFSAFTNVSTYIHWIYNSMRNRPVPTTTPLPTTTTPAPTTTTATPTTTSPKACENWKRTNICRKNETVLMSPVARKPEIAKPQLYTFMASLGAGNTANPRNYASLFVGALISDRWVLTAAGCFPQKTRPSTLVFPEWVILGDLDLYSTSDDAGRLVKRIADVIIHPDYKADEAAQLNLPYKSNIDNNIALVKLDSPVVFNEYLAPACLPTSAQIPVEKVMLNGWGYLTTKDSSSLNLLASGSPLVNITEITECIQPEELAYSLADRVICAKHRICEGIFAGAPLTYTQDGGCTWTLVGIAAYRGVCDIISPTASYTRVSAYLPWIKSVVWPNT